MGEEEDILVLMEKFNNEKVSLFDRKRAKAIENFIIGA